MKQPDETPHVELLDFALELAEKANKLILDGQAKRWTAPPKQTAVKKNSVDLVTETDQAVEAIIKTSVLDRYPSHRFIGEESWEAGQRDGLTDEYTWFVDPIDGTMKWMTLTPEKILLTIVDE